MKRCHFTDANNGGHRIGSLVQGLWGLVPLNSAVLTDREEICNFFPSHSSFLHSLNIKTEVFHLGIWNLGLK